MTSPPESAFWAAVRRSAAPVLRGPDWMKDGIVISDVQFVTYPPELKR